jgi:hypothetical protein
MGNDIASQIILTLNRIFQAFPQWLYDWQTLIGAIFAALVAVGAAVVAWKAAMKQIAVVQSERDRRSKYAAGIAISYLNSAYQISLRIEREEKRLAKITEDIWRRDPNQIVSVLQAAQAVLSEPTGNPRPDDVEQYREELPLVLFADLRLVFRRENDLGETVAQLLAQQAVFGSFPLSDCQARMHNAVKKLKEAIDSAQFSFDRFRYE